MWVNSGEDQVTMEMANTSRRKLILYWNKKKKKSGIPKIKYILVFHTITKKNIKLKRKYPSPQQKRVVIHVL